MDKLHQRAKDLCDETESISSASDVTGKTRSVPTEEPAEDTAALSGGP